MNFHTNKVKRGSEQYFNQSAEHLLEVELSFFSAWGIINIIIFICTPRVSVKAHALLLSLFIGIYLC